MAEQTETMVVRFEGDDHYEFHQILIEHGFDFYVHHDLRIGENYRHPTKPVLVDLRRADHPDDGYDVVCMKPNGDVYLEADYSDMEQRWIFDRSISDHDALRRELHVLIKVRPRSLNTLIALDGKTQ
jgi:hypothetical protein